MGRRINLFSLWVLFFFNLNLMPSESVAGPTWPHSIGFLPNRGQLADEAGLPASAPWYLIRERVTLALYPDRLAISWGSVFPSESGPAPGRLLHRADLRLVGANAQAQLKASRPSGSIFNFYHDHCPQGVEGVPDFQELTATEVWPGIDWKLEPRSSGLKYDFVVSPCADPRSIRLKWEGMQALVIESESGKLVARHAAGRWEEAAPVAWQLQGTDTLWVPVSFQLDEAGFVSFRLGDYDPHLPLVIDPLVRIWGTYYGGNLEESFRDVVLDPQARYYFIGETQSATPALATPGTQQPVHGAAPAGGTTDVLLVKFDVLGNLVWGTFYGGVEADGGRSLALDREGNLFAAGYTNTASGLMGTANSCQPLSGGGQDAFVAKFNPQDGRRVWSTYLGGSGIEQAGNDLAVDECGNILFVGTTASLDYADSEGRLNTSTNALVVKLRNFNGGCAWRQFVGGAGVEEGWTVDVEGCGETRNFLLIGGRTGSASDLATPGIHQDTYGGGASDGFIARLNNASGRLVWLTYLGGTGDESVQSLAVDGCGFVFATGTTTSPDAIATAGTHQSASSGNGDAFAVKFNTSGQRLWGTYFGGPEADEGLSISVEGCDGANVYLSGRTQSNTGIASANGWQATKGPAGSDGWVARFDGFTGSRNWGSYLGGRQTTAFRVLKSWRSDVVVAGQTENLGAAVGATPPAISFQAASAGAADAFILLLTE